MEIILVCMAHFWHCWGFRCGLFPYVCLYRPDFICYVLFSRLCFTAPPCTSRSWIQVHICQVSFHYRLFLQHLPLEGVFIFNVPRAQVALIVAVFFFSTDALHHCLLQFMPLQYRTYEPRHARVAVVCMRARHPRRMMSKTKHSWMRMSWRRRHLWDSTVIVHAQSGLYAWEDIARHRGMLWCLLLLPNLWLVSQRMVCEKVCGKGYVFCWPEHSAGVVNLARRIGGGC